MADDFAEGVRPGSYEVDYYSSAQVSVFIGRYWIDEITSMSWVVQQGRRPIYGYSNDLYNQLTKGQVLVQGQFTINFKEAGYLWLVLNEFQKDISERPDSRKHPFVKLSGEGLAEAIVKDNVENILNGESTIDEKTATLNELSTLASYAALGGFSSGVRASGDVGVAENVFETFENQVWGGDADNTSPAELDAIARRTDHPLLNPFDIYVAYGDFDGDDRRNHTIIKLSEVSILSQGQRIDLGPNNIQEQYSFVARNIH